MATNRRFEITLHLWQVEYMTSQLVSKKPQLVSKCHGARCSSVVRAFAHGAMGRQIDLSRGGAIELFHVPASAP